MPAAESGDVVGALTVAVHRRQTDLPQKPVALSSEILLDRERCVLCARCTRFSDEIAGDPFIDLARSRCAATGQRLRIDQPFESYFSGNTVQICPVGAPDRHRVPFRARPFDLVSTPSVCEHCASGCAQRTDHRRGKVLRRLAGDDPEVNEEWNCDKGRWAFAYTTATDRLRHPLVRGKDGELHETSWGQALSAAATGLRSAISGGVGVLTGGRITVEDAYTYSRFARTVLHTNDIDFRVREHSDEEAGFLAAHIAGQGFEVTYDDLSAAPAGTARRVRTEEESRSSSAAARARRGPTRHRRAIRLPGNQSCGRNSSAPAPAASPRC